MSEGCDRYTADTDTATIDVEYVTDRDGPTLDDGMIVITVVGADSTAEWTITCDEARQIAMGIVTVIR